MNLVPLRYPASDTNCIRSINNRRPYRILYGTRAEYCGMFIDIRFNDSCNCGTIYGWMYRVAPYLPPMNLWMIFGFGRCDDCTNGCGNPSSVFYYLVKTVRLGSWHCSFRTKSWLGGYLLAKMRMFLKVIISWAIFRYPCEPIHVCCTSSSFYIISGLFIHRNKGLILIYSIQY